MQADLRERKRDKGVGGRNKLMGVLIACVSLDLVLQILCLVCTAQLHARVGVGFKLHIPVCRAWSLETQVFGFTGCQRADTPSSMPGANKLNMLI